jgi:malto-oligosyltrehalose trehalohydrolase
MHYRFGPSLTNTGTAIRHWAPSQPGVDLLLQDRDPLSMQRGDDGFWSVHAEGVGPGAPYMFRAAGSDFPDPASRQQQDGVGGWSLVRAPAARPPHAGPLRPWHETILCEVHVGAVTPEGTFRALTERLEHFRAAGYTGLELMPLNAFPGVRNWGYDGTLIFAPAGAYGTPDELRALVGRAHELGLSVLVDVVYNHFGDVQNFIPRYAPEFFTDDACTPWGAAVDVRRPPVRQFFYENACWWLEEYDVDGLRLDAIHEIRTEDRDLFLGELARAARSVKPGASLVVENVRNQMHWLTRNDDGTAVDFTAQWNDDYHHVMTYLVTGEKKQGYGDQSRDPVADLEKSLADGFVHDGDADGESDGRTRNEPASLLPMQAFVAFMQNHDQIGNRADGKRIVDRVDAGRLDFGHFVTLLNPQIPMFFMGDEAQLRRGFPFFVDLPPDIAAARAQDRLDQMRGMFGESLEGVVLPDPGDPATFASARLPWEAFAGAEHRQALARFRELCALRREHVWPLAATGCLESRSARQGNGLVVTWGCEAGTWNMVLNPTGEPIEVTVELPEPAASTGCFRFVAGGLQLGPWSAVVWRG